MDEHECSLLRGRASVSYQFSCAFLIAGSQCLLPAISRVYPIASACSSGTVSADPRPSAPKYAHTANIYALPALRT
jgi:hypothetical protein